MGLQETMLIGGPLPAPVQQYFAATHPELIACRAELDWAVWDSLYEAHVKNGTLCEHLFDRALDTERFAAVMTAKSTKVGGLVSAARQNLNLVDDELVAAMPKLPAKAAAALVSAPALGPETRDRVALAAPPAVTLEYLLDRVDPSVVDPAVLEHLLNADQWWPKRPSKTVNHFVRCLIDLSPGVAAALCEQVATIPEQLVMSLASSHQLDSTAAEQLAERVLALTGDSRGYAAMALISNPRTPIGVAESVANRCDSVMSSYTGRVNRRGDRHMAVPPQDCDDVDLVKWAASRSVSTEMRPEGRPAAAVAVVLSPVFNELGEFQQRALVEYATGWAVPYAVAVMAARHLGVEVARTEHEGIPDEPGDDRDDPPTTRTVELADVKVHQLEYMHSDRRSVVFQLIAERLGDEPVNWRTFFELAQGFTGTTEELCDLVSVSW